MRFTVHAPVNGMAPPLGSALTPTMVKAAGAWSSRGKVFGQPGTMAIPMADPVAIRQTNNDLTHVGVFSPRYAPKVIFPPLYWEADSPHEHAPVSRVSDNQMPVPAGRPVGRVLFRAYKTRHGGQRQVVQPQVVQTWRGMYAR